MLAVWWVWVAAALALGIAEIFLPGFIFLGFAIGALVTGILLGVGGPVAIWMAGSLPVTLLIFAILSLVAWVVLRRAVGVRVGQRKVWDRDINDD